jgi:catechol 2,3-dioxygenase-like lactoylglutathione lyase family enzyme
MTINHLHIGTKDLNKSVDFYVRHFGFKKKFDHAPGIFLECKEGKFLLAIDPVERLPEMPKWFHYGFCLSSEDQVLKMHEKMKSEGAEVVRELMHEKDGFASFFVNDPDGNRIEVSWHNE